MISLVLLVIFTQEALPLSLHFYSTPIEATLYLLTAIVFLKFKEVERLILLFTMGKMTSHICLTQICLWMTTLLFNPCKILAFFTSVFKVKYQQGLREEKLKEIYDILPSQIWNCT